MNNRTCCWVLVVIGVLVVCVILGTGMLITSAVFKGGDRKSVVHEGTYLTVDISGILTEYRPSPQINFGRSRPSTVSDILAALDRAAKDSRIAGVVLRPSGTGGFAELRELREAIVRFRTCGKPVYAYLEMATDRDYYLASVADTVVVNPTHAGGLIFLGLSAGSTYLSRTFDKVGIKFNVLHVGKFKGAYENLASDSMSGPLRESLTTLLDDAFATYATETANSRTRLTAEQFQQKILEPTDLFIFGKEAVESGLADLAMDWGDFRERIKIGEKFHTISPVKYIRGKGAIKGSNEVAIVYAQGEISYGESNESPWESGEGIYSTDFIPLLRDLREDDDVKAVVLRVNSPGGSALASELILNEIKRLRQVKPVVVSMGNVAASGGYYISCAANKIVAQPNTITGSIGVVSVIPNAEGLFHKIGARRQIVLKGKWAEFARPDKPMSKDDEAMLMRYMTAVYDDFVAHVAEGRGISEDSVELSAEGRIWTGNQALKRGLVDELGDLNHAVSQAQQLAKLDPKTASVRAYPREKDIIQMVMRWIGASVSRIRDRIFLSDAELLASRAMEYLNRFMHQRDYVQAIMPVEIQ